MEKTSEFELHGRIGIGQYFPADTILHSTDPRVKLILGCLLVVASVLCTSVISLFILFIAVLSGFFVENLTLRVPLKWLRGMTPFLVVLALIQMFAVPQLREDSNLLWRWHFLILTERSLLAGLLLIGRFAVILMGLNLFSFCTSTTQLIHGIEQLLRPLEKLRFPAHELSLVLTISIRFLPILVDDAERIMKAQASRGADFGDRRGGLIKRFRRMLPIIVPLFLLSLRHAYGLAEAMEARCYLGGRGRTHLIQLRAGGMDYAILAAGLSSIGMALVINYLNGDMLFLRWIKGWKC